MKIMHIVGARPQFIKMAMVSNAWRGVGEEIILHTGQHYDLKMSLQFFTELNIPQPNINLEVGSGPHGEQTADMLKGIERSILEKKPDHVAVYGDTNSTLAGALAAAKLRMPVTHVEAGLRSFNRNMPEEINRVLADHLADFLFCPTQQAVLNLENEGLRHNVFQVGDVMADALFQLVEKAKQDPTILDDLNIQPSKYALVTLHRAGNVDEKETLRSIIIALGQIDQTIVFPVHPRTQKMMDEYQIQSPANVIRTEPMGYLNMLMLESQAECILTDSGGVQKEAYLFGIRCITLREETEWVETVQSGWNCLAGTSTDTIVEKYRNFFPPHERPPLFGDGHAADKIVDILKVKRNEK